MCKNRLRPEAVMRILAPGGHAMTVRDDAESDFFFISVSEME